MTLIFFDPTKNIWYIATESEKMRIIDGNEDVMEHIPDDDVLCIKDGFIASKEQFAQHLRGEVNLQPQSQQYYQDEFDSGFRFEPTQTSPSSTDQHQQIVNKNRLYVHPARPGTIIIPDIVANGHPDGLTLNGKWDFYPLDKLPEESIEESHLFKHLIAKGKIEIVNYDYVQKHKHKKRKQSAGDAALDAILIQDQQQGAARAIAASGGMYMGGGGASPGGHTGDGAIEIYVD